MSETLKEALEKIARICEEKAKQAERKSLPIVPKCDNCEGHGLLYRCSVTDGATYWGACRCRCGQAFDFGTTGKDEKGNTVSGNRPFGTDIPSEFEVCDIRGVKLNREDLYTLSERLHAEDMLNAGTTDEAQVERDAIQDEPNYEFPL